MRRVTLHIALSALFASAMLMGASSALAQSRGGRADNRSERRSAIAERRGASSVNQGGVSSRRGGERRDMGSINRNDNRVTRNEVSHWPNNNNGGRTGISDMGGRDRANVEARRNSTRRQFGERSVDNNNGNIGGRPGNNNRPGGNIADRPGNGGGRPNDGYRPGNGNGRPNDGYRPGNGNGRPNDGYRPGNGNGRPNDGFRPGNGNGRPNDGYRPGNGGGRPNDGYRPGVGRPHSPGHVHMPPSHHGVIVHRPGSWHTPVAPPYRSFRPVCHHIFRPVPPPHYRPWHRAPVISGILGLTFGTAYYTSLDYLFNRGYEIDGYYDGVVYLRNIQELSCFWPDVMLNYGTGRTLSSAEFHYSTSYDDLGRFNRLYSDLCSRYGQPMRYIEDDEGIRSTWYGGNARGFVSLEYFYRNSRFYTTLSYGGI